MILGDLVSGALSGVLNGMFGRVFDVVDAFMRKQITEVELKAKLEQLRVETQADVDKAILDAATKTWSEFQATVRTSPIVARAFIAVMTSQLFVLLWAQLLGPALKAAGWTTWEVPDSGVSAALWLLVVTLGGSPLVFKGLPPGIGPR